MRRLAPLFIISAASLLTACGGGGGSDNSAGSPAGGQSTGSSTSLTGRFVDGPISGLRYSTPTSNGRTNANGEITYRQGETVSFFIGAVLIGQAPGAATITPFSLAGTAPPTSTLDIVKAVRLINAHRVNANNTATPLEVAGNIATFLQTVDSDGAPANGIQVPAAKDGLTTGKSIDFRQTFSRFKVDAGVQALIAAGRSAGGWSGSRTLKDPFLALDALYSGLGISPAIKSISSTAFDTGGNERLYPGVDLEAAEGLTEIDALARGETVHCRGYLYAVGRVAVAVHGLQEGRDIARDFQRRGRVVRVDAVGVDEPHGLHDVQGRGRRRRAREAERRDRRGARRLADEGGADEKAHGFALPIGEFAFGVGPAVGRRGAVAQAGYRTIDETSRERRRRAGGLAAGGRTGAVVGAASSAAGGQQAGGRDDEQWC